MSNNNETTTKFKVDISELKKGIQDAKKQIAVANSEFKAISSSMDNWADSSDGVNAKLKQLDTVMSNQEKILNSLEEQYAQVVEEQGATSKGAQDLLIKLNNQKAVVNNVAKEIKNYSQRLDDVTQAEDEAARTGRSVSDILNDVGDSAEDAGNSAEDASGGFTVMKGALSSLVADGIRATIDAFKELISTTDQASNIFQSATGASAQAMEGYNDAIEAVYKNNFGESLQDVAEKMAKVKEVTGEVDASKLQEMTESAITLEDTFGMDMTETLRGVDNLMTHFGLSADEAFDLMASGAQNGLNYSDELGDNVTEYSGKFAEAGYSAEEYFQLLKNGSDGGAYNLDKVNDSINEVTARLADGTIGDSIGMFSSGTQELFKAWQNGEATQKDVINSIVGDIRNTTNEQEKMNLSAKAFGTMAEDGGTMFIQSLDALGSSFDSTKGKMDEIKDTRYDDVTSQLSGLGRTVKTDIITPFVEELLPYLKDGIQWVVDNLPAITEKATALSGAITTVITFIQNNLPTIISLATTLLTTFVAFNIVGWIAKLKKAFLGLNAVMSANPIGLIILAIGALVTAFIYLWNNCDEFRQFWIDLWASITSFASSAVEAIKTFFTVTIPEAFNAVIEWVKANWQSLLLMLINPFAGLFKYFYDNNSKFKEFVDNAVNAIKELPGKIWTWLVNTITKVSEFATDLTQKGREAGQNLINAIVEKVKEIPDKVRSIGSDIVRGLWNGINDMVGWIGEKIKGFGDSVLSGLKDFFGIHSPSKLMEDEIGKFIPEGIAVGIDKNAKSVLSSMRTLTSNSVASARSGLSTVSGGLNSGSSAIGGVTNVFNQTINSPKQLSRLDVYRQSKNLLGYAGGGL